MRNRAFSLLIKPASADCNLRCAYCFYLDHINLYPEDKIHRMNEETLEQMISSYMKTPQPVYVFGWQGGEPTLMGLDFFKKVVELEKRYAPKGATISNGLQTNAILITDEMAEFFGEYKFLIGVSLDGPEEIHNYYRYDANKRGSFNKVKSAIKRLEKYRVEFNILTLVTNINVDKGKEIYRYLCSEGYFFHQYIPCVEFDSSGKPLPFTITGESWGKFLCEVFEEWLKDFKSGRFSSIRLFDSILYYLVENRYSICHMNNNCCQYFVVEYNGDVYPCDFFVEKKRKLGNVKEESWEKFLNNKKYLEFGALKSKWNPICNECEYLPFCNGDCLKHRIYNNNPPQTLSWLCEGWKLFYKETLPEFKKIAENIKKERREALLNSEIGRNDPCPCGSGKKYKKCCGRLI